MSSRPLPDWLQDCAGLRPRTWVCVGEGYEREGIKATVLNAGLRLSGNGVLSPRDLVMGILTGHGDSPVFLSDAARRDWLRVLFFKLRKEPEILALLPSLLRLKRERPFLKRLDAALQSARLSFAHFQEAQVLQERLEALTGKSRPLQDELRLFTIRYEAELKAMNQYDWPLALRTATEILETQGWPQGLPRPERIVIVSTGGHEPLEARFWSEVARWVQIEREGIPERTVVGAPVRRFHIMEDAVESLADQVQMETDVVLIPDDPEIRRVLTRVLKERGLWLLDPRDPTQARLSEEIKRQFAPLKALATGFEVKDLWPWLSREEIETKAEAGQLRGLDGLQQPWLEEMATAFPSRLTLETLIRTYQKFQTGPELEKFWTVFYNECEELGLAEKRWPLRFWWERIAERLHDLKPSPEALRPTNGVRLYRLSQAAWDLPEGVKNSGRLWVLSCPPGWLTAEDTSGFGDLWFSERDRDVLSGEFGIQNSHDIAIRRRSLLADWMSRVSEVIFLDAEFDMNGQERESVASALQAVFKADFPIEKMASHPRWRDTFGPPAWRRPAPIVLPAAADRGVKTLSASQLDAASRCTFKGLVGARWRLEDLGEADLDPRATAKGNWLHKAAELLVKALTEKRKVSVSEAVDQAAALGREGLIRSPRAEALVRRQMIKVLEIFLEKEIAFREQSGATLRATEESAVFEAKFGEMTVKGRADRIDEHPDGLWVVDYKSGSDFPHGSEILEKSYALQLPFYAVAAREKFKKEVIGAQYIGLNSGGSRIKGLFFKEWFGKEKGNLVNSRSKESLMADLPEVVWSGFEKRIGEAVAEYAAGHFHAHPKKPSDCDRCYAREMCGILRSPASEVEATTAEGSA